MFSKKFLAKLNRRDTPLFPRIPAFAKYIFIFLFVFTSVFYTTRVIAANDLQNTIDGMKAGGNLETWLGADAFRINIVGILDALTDIKNAPAEIIQGLTTSTGKVPFWIPGGMVGSVNNTVASLYTPPASGIEYLAEMKDNFLGKPAYAQGVGFQGLQPILPIWRAFRNVVYIIASLIFVMIGIMIMLRVKISPQAVISLQSALPNLISALILVTFSYAICGLIIDAMYIFQSVFLTIIFSGVGKNLSDNLLSASIPPVSTNFSSLSNFNFGTAFWLSIKNINLLIISGIGALIGGVIGLIVGGLGGAAVGSIGVLVFALIMVIVIAFSIIKFMFGLIKCYVTLLFKIILAPLEIGMGAFPNSKLNFDSWVVDVIANISVFPISLLFLVIVNVIAESVNGTNLWAPSIIGITGNFLPFIIAMGGLLLLPKLPEMIPQFIFMLKPSPWGQAIGQSISGPAAFAKNMAANAIADDSTPLGAAVNRIPFIDTIGGNIAVGNLIKGK